MLQPLAEEECCVDDIGVNSTGAEQIFAPLGLPIQDQRLGYRSFFYRLMLDSVNRQIRLLEVPW